MFRLKKDFCVFFYMEVITEGSRRMDEIQQKKGKFEYRDLETWKKLLSAGL